jgi:hypothetical protein
MRAIALTNVLTIEDPYRFPKSRADFSGYDVAAGALGRAMSAKRTTVGYVVLGVKIEDPGRIRSPKMRVISPPGEDE